MQSPIQSSGNQPKRYKSLFKKSHPQFIVYSCEQRVTSSLYHTARYSEWLGTIGVMVTAIKTSLIKVRTPWKSKVPVACSLFRGKPWL